MEHQVMLQISDSAKKDLTILLRSHNILDKDEVDGCGQVALNYNNGKVCKIVLTKEFK